MSDNHIKTIAIVGASGNAGAPILAALLATNNFDITVISRTESTATFPTSVTVKKAAYDDSTALQSAFRGNDVAIFALSFRATEQAAAKAGVKWLLPNEYAADTSNDAMVGLVPLFQPKREARKFIEGLVAKGGVYEGLHSGLLGIKPSEKKFKAYEGAGKFNISTVTKVGKGVANLLSLPTTNDVNPRASLSHYANNYVYISSFHTSQEELFEKVQKASGTSSSDWTTEHTTVKDTIATMQGRLAKGEFSFEVIGELGKAVYMGEGMGGDYEGKAREDSKLLGLEQEDLDEVVKEVLSQKPPVPF